LFNIEFEPTKQTRRPGHAGELKKANRKAMIYGLDLFSGIGGLTIALQEWVVPIAYCENDRYAQAVLLSRMSEGELPIAPIWDDVKTLRARHLPVKPDIITAGFPCQDISVAGVGRGLEGKRSGLFFEIIRLANELRPKFIFLENVSGIATRGGWGVSTALSEIRYDSRWGMLSAYDMGAPHIRERWFCLAYSNDSRKQQPKRSGQIKRERSCNGSKALAFPPKPGLQDRTSEKGRQNGLSEQFERYSFSVADSDSKRPMDKRKGRSLPEESMLGSCSGGRDWWETEPDVGRVVDGLPYRVDRIKCLGNAVVTCQAREAFVRLMGHAGESEEES